MSIAVVAFVWLVGWALLHYIARKLASTGRGSGNPDGLSASSAYCIVYKCSMRTKTARNHRYFVLRGFYALGAVTGTIGMAVSIIVLSANFFVNILKAVRMFGLPISSSEAQGNSASENEQHPYSLDTGLGHLTPLIPGINLPVNHAGYLILAAIISLVVHEAGHAIAAVGEGVRVTEFGVFLALVVPGAFVRLDDEIIEFIPAYKRLRIFAAGPWHNMVLCGLCLLARRLLPLVLSIAYASPSRHRAAVTSLRADSALKGHLRPGDAIASVDSCEIIMTEKNNGWLECLSGIAVRPSVLSSRGGIEDAQDGFCASATVWRDGIERDSFLAAPDCCAHLPMHPQTVQLQATHGMEEQHAGIQEGRSERPASSSSVVAGESSEGVHVDDSWTTATNRRANEGDDVHVRLGGKGADTTSHSVTVTSASTHDSESTQGVQRSGEHANNTQGYIKSEVKGSTVHADASTAEDEEQMEREATLEAIHESRGERERVGERSDWADPDLLKRMTAAKERSRLRKQAATQHTSHHDTHLAFSNDATDHDSAQRVGVDAEDAAHRHAQGSARRLLSADGDEAMSMRADVSGADLCFVEGWDQKTRTVSRAGAACVDAKAIATVGVRRCKSHEECEGGVCVWAVPEAGVSLLPIEIERKGRGRGVVLFLGTSYELFDSVAVSSWRLRDIIFSDMIAAWEVPEVVDRLFAYICAVSASIALVNLAPVQKLDGHMMFQAAWEMARGIKSKQEGSSSADLIPQRTAKFASTLLLASILSSFATARMTE